MLRWAGRLLSKQRELRMIWRVEKGGRSSLLIGCAHFFPYHFRGDLRRILSGATTVVLEGPLDEQAMRRVVDSGRGAGELYDALDAEAKSRILRMLGIPAAPLDAHQLLKELIFGRQEQWFESELRSLKPWLAFFGIWTRYRARHGWTYTLDLDAATIAAELRKEVRYLETIDEQIAALDSLPLERIVRFLAGEDWVEYGEKYVRRYLAGDLDGLMAVAQAFPTYCEPIVERRDPVLAERMLPALEEGGAVAFIGVTHCRGVLSVLRERQFAVASLTSHYQKDVLRY